MELFKRKQIRLKNNLKGTISLKTLQMPGKISIIAMHALVFLIIFINTSCANYVLKDTEIGAISAILMDYKTGKVLWEKNSHEKRAMASTTKIMTAILAIENCDLNEIVVASKYASSMPETKMGVKEGEKHTLENLLYALMLKSANDAAVAIAEHISGSVENFSKLMNQKAIEIGAKDTNFVTPNGLDNGLETHYSTAYDMALITRYALKNNEFRKIITTQHKEIMSTDKEKYILSNTNRLLNEYEGSIGVKTGFTNLAGHCFVGAAEFKEYTAISVVLASGWGNKGKNGKWIDTKKILTYGKENFELKKIIEKSQEICTNFDVGELYDNNRGITLYSNQEVSVPYLKNIIPQNIRLEIKKIPLEKNKSLHNFSISKETILANADIYIDSEYIATIELVNRKDVKLVSFKNSLEIVEKVFKTLFI